VGLPWWNYVDEFLYRCSEEEYFTNEDCIKDAMQHAGVDFDKIQGCMADSGGIEGDVENTVLEEELAAREASGVVIMPSLFVNQATIRGALAASEVFEAICAGFVAGSEPDACTNCNKCGDVQTCVEIGHCPGIGPANSVSMPTFYGALACVVGIFSCLGMIQWQRSQRQMRAQVRGIMAEYMPLDENNKVESVGIPEDEDDDGVELN